MTKINSIGGGGFGSIVEGRICRTHKLCGGFLLLLSLTLVSCGGGGGGGGGSVATPLATLGISNFTFTPAPDSIALSWTNPTNSSRAISQFNISIAGYSSKLGGDAVYSNSNLLDYTGDGMTQTASFTNLNADLHYEVLFQAIYTDESLSDAINALARALFPRRALGVDTDGDGFADADDIDDDDDGRLDAIDNCPLLLGGNTNQADNDNDGFAADARANATKGGDICDNDDDNDGQLDDADNCPLLLGGNTNQADNDNDYDANDRANRNKGGDACDEDDDNDGQLDDADNCPLVANPDQADTDNDYDPNDRANPAKGGDSCDNDDDNDGIADTADVDNNGDGLIEISTHEQFNMIRHNLAGTNLTSTAGGDGDASGCVRVASRVDSSRTPCYGYELTADISLASYSNWVPIGTCNSNNYCPNSFSGVFDGNNHSISNLIIDISSESYGVGLFGSIAPAAILRDLTLINVNIGTTSSGDDFGSLVGYGREASILDVRAVNVTISAANVESVGGLIGDGWNSTVSSSSVVAHSIGGSRRVGGLLGYGESSIVSSSSVVAHSISGSSDHVGGLIGWGQSSTVSSSSVVAHSISGSFSNIGGLIGWGQSSTVSSSSVVAHSISGSSDYVGGLIGWGQNSTVSSSLVLGGSLNGTSHVGGIVGTSGTISGGNRNPGGVSNSYWLDSIVFTDAQQLSTNTFGESKSVTEIQSPTGFTGIYADWANGWCDSATGEFTTSPTHRLATAGGGNTYRAWDLGNSMQYPTMTCFGDRLTPAQQRAATTKVLNDESPLPAP